jgi:toxin-antitoxin system PIN domain toxin
MILPDVNLIVYAYDLNSIFHQQSRTWWEEIHNGSEPIGIPWEVSLGFLRLVTHPRVFRNPIPVRDALAIVATWFQGGIAEPIGPGERHLERLTSCLGEVGIGNKLVMDAHVAAMAKEYRAVLYTNDRDFERFSGLRIKNPLI